MLFFNDLIDVKKTYSRIWICLNLIFSCSKVFFIAMIYNLEISYVPIPNAIRFLFVLVWGKKYSIFCFQSDKIHQRK